MNFLHTDIIEINEQFKKAGFYISQQDKEEQKEGVWHLYFENKKEVVSIEDAIMNLQKLKKIAENVNLRFSIVQHLPSLRVDVSN